MQRSSVLSLPSLGSPIGYSGRGEAHPLRVQRHGLDGSWVVKGLDLHDVKGKAAFLLHRLYHLVDGAPVCGQGAEGQRARGQEFPRARQLSSRRGQVGKAVGRAGKSWLRRGSQDWGGAGRGECDQEPEGSPEIFEGWATEAILGGPRLHWATEQQSQLSYRHHPETLRA